MNALPSLYKPVAIIPRLGRNGLPITDNYDDPVDINDAWADYNDTDDMSVVGFFNYDRGQNVTLVAVGIEEDGLTVYRTPEYLAETGLLPLEAQMRIESAQADHIADYGWAA